VSRKTSTLAYEMDTEQNYTSFLEGNFNLGFQDSHSSDFLVASDDVTEIGGRIIVSF